MLPGQTDDLHIPCQFFRLIGPMVHVHGKRAQTGIAADLCSGCFRPPLVLVVGWWVEDGGVTFRGFGAVERWHQGVCFARAACGRQQQALLHPFKRALVQTFTITFPPLAHAPALKMPFSSLLNQKVGIDMWGPSMNPKSFFQLPVQQTPSFKSPLTKTPRDNDKQQQMANHDK